MNDKTLKLSDVLKWTGMRTQMSQGTDLERANACVNLAQRVKYPLGLVAEECGEGAATILQDVAVCAEYAGFVEEFDGQVWLPQRQCLDRRRTYRLRSDVTVVHNTGDGFEYVEVFRNHQGKWRYSIRQEATYGSESLMLAADDDDYVCLEVKDAEGKVWYIACWAGSHAACYLYASIEDLLAGKPANEYSSLTEDAAPRPLTPTRVVFRKGRD